MKRNTALEMQAEEFDFFKKHEPETQQKPREKEPAIKELHSKKLKHFGLLLVFCWQ